jgi:uncharacterized protein (DUF302 family)
MREMDTMGYGTGIRLRASFDDAAARVRSALRDQGFGVLTEIDVQATLKEKIGEDMEPYLILGACNPPLAHRALGVDRRIGLLLPCNVVVRAEGDVIVVEALDPQIMVGLSGRAALAPVADEAAARLGAALDALGGEPVREQPAARA